MRIYPIYIFLLLLISFPLHAKKSNPLKIIAKEPVTMMDLGIIKLNSSLSRQNQPGLKEATMGATYNARKGLIEIKVSMPVKKASRSQCKKIINNAKKLFVKSRGNGKISSIHHYFQHEGTEYSRSINWDHVANHVVITAVALTRKNYQDSIYCESRLMKKKVTY
ncbi:MAG: hypothetical protein OEY00_11920 [Gammaproteobacteria bacterium]|nr:hypothetical protein [Gammaproteobacteria bacterium]